MKQLARVLGLVVFMGSLVLMAWWWLVVAGRAESAGGVSAAIVDVCLFSLFALHHSLLARPWAQQQVRRVLPEDLVRTSYVWIGSLLLIAVCLLWEPVGRIIYNVNGAWAALLYAVQLIGAAIGTLAVRRISVRELAGLVPPGSVDELECRGPYRLVRHPLYLGWVLVFFGTPHMTGDRLIFAFISSAYLIVAMPLEEAGLRRQFGERYLEYCRMVRWRLIPYVH